MTSRQIIIAAVALMAASLAACGQTPAPAPLPTPIPITAPTCNPSLILTEKDNSQTVQVAKGSSFGIRLTTNPSTGYEWGVDNLDASHLSQGGSVYSSEVGAQPGSGGEVTLCFTAIGTGTTSLKLAYRQPWATNVEPLEIFEITVEIGE